MERKIPKESTFGAWVVLCLLVLLILVQGFFAYFAVGDLGQPDWDYRPVKDVPGQSPYAIYEKLPYPQHVRGEKGE
jgi:hypothetical protein